MKKPAPQLFLILIFIHVLAAVAASTAQAQTNRYVALSGSNSGNNCTNQGSPCSSIQYAIDQSNSGDTIHLSGEVFTQGVIAINKSITILGAGPSIIQASAAAPGTVGAASGRVIFIVPSVVVTISSVVIRHGNVTSATGTQNDDGGGIHNRGSLTLNYVVFSNNYAYSGGGLYTIGNTVMNNVLFLDNETGAHGGGVFCEFSSCELDLTEVTFTNNSATFGGGGIFINGTASAAKLSQVQFNGNSAGNRGGGIYNVGTSPTLVDVTFNENSAEEEGGGIYNTNNANTVLTNVVFNRNSAVVGAGMYNSHNSSAELTNVHFTENVAGGAGGGMMNRESSPFLNEVHFTGNEAYGSGGGMYNGYDSHPYLLHVTFSDNKALNPESSGVGGGMANRSNSNPTLNKVIFSGNRANFGGGGFYNWESSPTIINSLFIRNSAGNGGSLFNSSNSSAVVVNATFLQTGTYGGIDNRLNSSITIYNSIIWRTVYGYSITNSADSDGNIYNSILVEVCPSGFTCSSVTNQHPMFEDIDSDDFRLRPGSPAINGGTNTPYNLGGPAFTIATDIANNPRIIYDTVDIGAYEWAWEGGSQLYVSGIASGNNTGLNWTNAYNHLQVALSTAKAVNDGIGYNEVNQIWVRRGTYVPTQDNSNREASFQLVSGVAVYGGFNGNETALSQRDFKVNETILSGDINQSGNQTGNSFHVVNGSGVASNTLLNGFTITGGNANGTSSNSTGGGIYIDGGSPTLTNLYIINNEGASGGGISTVNTGSPLLTNIVFQGNKGGTGGGGAMFNDNSSPTVVNATFHSNISGGGGAIRNHNNSSLDLINSILWGNNAQDIGNEIFNSGDSSVSLSYSLYGNEPGDIEGAGVSASNSISVDPLFNNHTFLNNLRLSNGSPAINAGTNTAYQPGGPSFGVTTDIDGNPRIQNDLVDIGAYEHENGSEITGTFITTWQVEAGDLDITIPIEGTGYDFMVLWGDGTSTNWEDGDPVANLTHTYAAADIYTVEITGDFPRIYFNDAGDKDKILTIEQWGDIEWASMEGAFRGATNLQINAAVAPDLSNVTNMQLMFAGATSLNSDFNHWDTSTITVMSQLFSGATAFNGAIDQWDVSSVTTMFQMFRNAASFNQDLNDWDLSGITAIDAMFWGAASFNGNITGWSLPGGVSNLSNMFNEAAAFNQDISGWNVAGAVTMNGTFSGATSFDQNLGDWDISSVEGMSAMLSNTGLSSANYDATLTGWAAQAVQADVSLGAEGLEYCAIAERDILTEAPNSWEITGDALAAGCGPFVAEDVRILASNRSDFVFSDSGLDPAFSYRIVTLPDRGQLLLDGIPVAADDVISVMDIDDDKLSWSHTTDEHGYNYTSFTARIIDGGGTESDLFTVSIDLGAAFTEITHDGEGWRFMTSPSAGETFESLLGPIYTQGVPGSNNPGAANANLYRVDQPNYQWEVPGHMDNEIGIGEAFITYVFSDDNNNGTPDGFPKTLLFGEAWNELDGEYLFTNIGYDPDPAGVNPENFFLVGNPHPISIDFCEMFGAATNTASSIDVWNPSANGGNGDYLNLNCAVGDVHIAPFQGFWVRTTAPGPVLTIPQTAYLESMEAGFFKERSAMSQKVIADLGQGQESSVHGKWTDDTLINLQVQSDDGLFTNRVNILFSEQGSHGMDEIDAPKLSPAALASKWLSFHALDDEGRAYAFRHLPSDFGDQITVALDIQTTEAGDYTLKWTLPEARSFPGGYFLRDSHTESVIELKEGQIYRFEIEQGRASSSVHSGWTDDSLPTPSHSSVHGKWTDEVARFELLVAMAGVDGLAPLGDLPDRVSLDQNYPNPFNPSTIIHFELPQQGQVRLDVFDMVGRQVATLIDGSNMQAGRHQVNFDASGLTSGVYIYRLQSGNSVLSKKLTLIK